MTDLTEQWKKGELPNGIYYVELLGGNTMIAYMYKVHSYKNKTVYRVKAFNGFITKYQMKSVLSKAPDYDEWKATMGTAQFLMDKNAQLKELLKKANKFLKDYGFTFDGKDCAEAFKVHTKINQVLGEDE